MLVIGVTGGIGSGKSTVARLLGGLGARVLDADRVVAELYRGGPVPDVIERRMGPGLLRDDGSVDRAALGRLVFADVSARRTLEEIVHPEVRRVIVDSLNGWRQDGFSGVAVVDAALLVESEFAYPLDALVVVTAPEDVRLARLQARGLEPEEARRRMRAQASDEEKRARADLVIDNGGSLEQLEEEVNRALRELGGTTPPQGSRLARPGDEEERAP